MTPLPKSSETFIPVPGGRVYCRTISGPDVPPLIVVHGGPGIPHRQLQPLEALSADRPVIFYDQLGCGKSDRPDDTRLWHIDRFVDELAQVRNSLAPGPVHILGYSFGCMVVVDYALRKPLGIRSLILQSPYLSAQRCKEDQYRLRESLPNKLQAILNRHEKGEPGLTTDYKAAVLEYRMRHMLRNLIPWPRIISEVMRERNVEINRIMWGHIPFRISGNLENYERTSRLGEIETPTLLTCGRHDTSTPEAIHWYAGMFPQAETTVFENSSHWAHFEEKQSYLLTVGEFLRKVDASSP